MRHAALLRSDKGLGTPGTDRKKAKPAKAPVVSSFSVTNKRFALGAKKTAAAAKRRRAKRGTTFRYKLSEAATVTFTVQRKKGKRYVRARRFTKASKQGANKRKFVTRKLKPGRYRATLVATDAAKNRSKAKRITFRVVRR